MAAHCSVASPVAFVCGPVPKAVTPLFNHVEALGVPNVRFQPNVLTLTAVELQQQVSVTPPGLAALALCWLLLLFGASLEALLPLTEEGQVSGHVSGSQSGGLCI